MKEANAYWLSPKGTIYDVRTNHINFLRDNLKLFKLNRNKYEEVFKKYIVPLGWEGRAREELLILAMKHGWCRIRDYMNKGWSVEIWELDSFTKDNIFDWAVGVKKLINEKNELDERTSFYNHNSVNIHIIKLEKAKRPRPYWFIETSFDEIIQGKLHEKRKEIKNFDSFIEK